MKPVAGSMSIVVMAIVSLRSQRITVYDAKGWILRAPVSSGSKGRETPAGIFSVIQKVEEHYSNLYDDAFMPHMQRITWSGVAMHTTSTSLLSNRSRPIILALAPWASTLPLMSYTTT